MLRKQVRDFVKDRVPHVPGSQLIRGVPLNPAAGQIVVSAPEEAFDEDVSISAGREIWTIEADVTIYLSIVNAVIEDEIDQVLETVATAIEADENHPFLDFHRTRLITEIDAELDAPLAMGTITYSVMIEKGEVE